MKDWIRTVFVLNINNVIIDLVLTYNINNTPFLRRYAVNSFSGNPILTRSTFSWTFPQPRDIFPGGQGKQLKKTIRRVVFLTSLLGVFLPELLSAFRKSFLSVVAHHLLHAEDDWLMQKLSLRERPLLASCEYSYH